MAARIGGLAQENLSPAEAAFLGKLQNEGAGAQFFDCTKCKDHGFTVSEKGEAVQCSCARDRMYAGEYERCGIPPAHYHWTLNTHWNMHNDAFGDALGESAKKRKEAIQAFLTAYMDALPEVAKNRIPFKLKYPNGQRKSISSLLLVGGTGSGKSLIASIVAQAAVRKGVHTRFYDFLELIATLREFGKTTEQDALVAEWSMADLVVLDGFTGEYHMGDKGPFKYQFDRLAKARMNLAKPVVVTAAVDYKNLETGSAWRSLMSTFHTIDLPSRER
jgi:DNA replication protein DnaC